MKITLSSVAVVLSLAALAGGCSSDDENDDPRSKAISYAREDISCAAPEECCAVLDGCLAQFLIVSAQDKETVEGLLAEADDSACLACIPPFVQVDCVSGRCVGKMLESAGGSYEGVPTEFMKTHCGALPVPEGWVEKDVPDSEPASFEPQTVIGC